MLLFVVVGLVVESINNHSFYSTGEVITTIPTIGFNVETVDVRGLIMTAWDVGGRSGGLRALWRYYYKNMHGIIFMLDANDTERIDDARAELARYVCFVHCHILLVVTQLLTVVAVECWPNLSSAAACC